ASIFDLETCPVRAAFTYVDGEDPAPALRAAVAGAGVDGAELGVEDALWLGDADLVRATLPTVRLRRATPVFDRLRAVKDEFELEQLRVAASAHDAGYARAKDVIRPGVTVS